MLWETISARRRISQDVVATAGLLRFAAGRVRPQICLGENMVGSCGARTAANLGIASMLAIFLGACSSMSLPSFSSSPSAPPEAAPATQMPSSSRPDEIVGRWGLASFQNPNDRARPPPAARPLLKQPSYREAGTTRNLIMHQT